MLPEKTTIARLGLGILMAVMRVNGHPAGRVVSGYCSRYPDEPRKGQQDYVAQMRSICYNLRDRQLVS